MMKVSINVLYILLLLLGSCSDAPKVTNAPTAKRVVPSQPLLSQKTNEKQKLSEYGFFEAPLSDLIPNPRVYSYEVNTPLFSDYASKKRFLDLPDATQMEFSPTASTLRFEKGSVLIKNFYYPTSDGQERIIETRLLIKEKEGWKPLNYIWNEEQSDASLNYIGADIEVEWIFTRAVLSGACHSRFGHCNENCAHHVILMHTSHYLYVSSTCFNTHTSYIICFLFVNCLYRSDYIHITYQRL